MKHSLQTRVLSLVLAIVMVLGMMPMSAFATETQPETTAAVTEPVETSASVESEATETTEAPTTAEATEAPATTESTEAAETTGAAETTESTEAVETTESTEPVETTEETESTDPTETTEETVPSDDLALWSANGVYDPSVSEGYFNVISEKEYNLAPGALEREIVLNNAAGNDRKVVHVFEVNAANENVAVLPGYYGIDQLNPDDLAGDSAIWKAEQLTKTVAYYENTLGYNVVGAMNTALAYDSNAPYGYMVWDGVVLGTPEVHKGAQTYLAIYKDGTAELRSMSTPLDGNEWTAISANFGWLVKDGKLTSTSVERTSSDASRSMIGIKADGTIIFCQVDGRNGAVSSGLSNYEMGEMMLALGCVNAVNCDGGGSSTFVSKREGQTENVMRSVPSDGSERPTINSVIIVSKAQATGTFDHAVLSADYEFVAPGASLQIGATGVDAAGSPAEIPADVSWRVDDETFGSITSGGLFTAGEQTGEVLVQMVYNEKVVGEMLLNIVHPETFGFAAEATVAPYGKSIDLDIVATYGADSWAVCVDGAYSLSLSDENAGTLSGGKFVATDDESKTGVNITATYLPDESKSSVLKVTFGKGSEILFDFENKDVSPWMGFVDAKKWSQDHGVNNTLVGNDPLGGQFNEQISSDTFLASDGKGQVKNGDYALAWSLDNTDAGFAGWSYNVFFYVGEEVVLRDVANGKNATSLGMWLYIPEGAAGLAFQSQLYVRNADGSYSCKQDHFTFETVSGVRKNLNSCTEADIPESRWVYASINLTPYDFICIGDPTKTYGNSRSPSVIRTYVKPTAPAVLTFYIDDITLDYSSAVDDRVLPTISGVSYATADTSNALDNGTVVNGNDVAFSATVSDNAGLDASSGRIYVDGVSIGAAVSGKTLSGSAKLTSGEHTVSFEVQDRLGNLAKVTRTFTVAGDAVITLSGHNESGKPAEYDSIYYVDINAADINAINGINATIKLQTANTWEPQGMIVAPGFEASYSVDKVANTVSVSLTRTGASARTAGQTLVSIPVRVWSWNGVNNVTGVAIDPEAQFATGYCPIVTIDYEVVKSSVTFAAGQYDGYHATFGGEESVATNLNDTVNRWHYHNPVAVADVAATCTTAGYTGRTYCEGCSSVVAWGTITEATGHNHKIVNDQLVCDCGDVVTGNGLVTANGKIYCLIADKLVTGWQMVGDSWCYAAVSTKEVQTGEFGVNGLKYTADEQGLVIKGAWVTDANGTKYSFGPEFYKREWATIDGVDYYFGTDSYMYTGIQYIPVNRNNMKEGIIWYEFAEDGAYIGKVNGFVTYNDLKYYVVDGVFNYAGMIEIDGYFYYVRTSGQVVCGRSYYITKGNGYPVGNYTFDEEGRCTNPPVTEEPDVTDPTVPSESTEATEPSESTEATEPVVKNGIVEENGKKYWYVDGVKTYGGMMLIDGYFYYARSSGEIICGRGYWITKTNGYPAGQYFFDEEGRCTNPPVTGEPDVTEPSETTQPSVPSESTEPSETTKPSEPAVKNGIVEENGKKYWYVDGVKTYGGMMLIDGYFYYARSSGEIVCGRGYWITKTNGYPAGQYFFDEEGRCTNPPVTGEPDVTEPSETTQPSVPSESTEPSETTKPSEPAVKNGIVEENGKKYWYVDGVKTYGGFMLIDGYFYYARSSGEIVCGRTYWITKGNGYPIGGYTFDEEGRCTNPPAIN